MSEGTHPAASQRAIRSAQLRAGVAAGTGATLEQIDFFAYGTAAALVFPAVFFSGLNPGAALLVAYASFGAAQIMRPVGGLVFGHFGDKVGRKLLLVLSMGVMGVATFLIGCLPSYQAIGVAAPASLLVLRLLQGFALGGEQGGAILMAVEHAPEGHRGLWGAMPQISAAAGVGLANIYFLAITSFVSPESFQAWGWRLPFLSSLALVGVGLYLRSKVAESPVFDRLLKQRQTEIKAVPIVEAFRTGWWSILRIFGGMMYSNTMGFMTLVFIVGYATTTLGLRTQTILIFLIIGSVLEALVTLAAGHLSDRIGRKPLCLMGTGCGIVLALTFFSMVDTKNPALILFAIVAVRCTIGLVWGPQATLASELFDTNVRYSAISAAVSLSVIVGGFTPVAAVAIIESGNKSLLTMLLAGFASLAFLCFALMPETRNRDLDQRNAHER